MQFGLNLQGPKYSLHDVIINSPLPVLRRSIVIPKDFVVRASITLSARHKTFIVILVKVDRVTHRRRLGWSVVRTSWRFWCDVQSASRLKPLGGTTPTTSRGLHFVGRQEQIYLSWKQQRWDSTHYKSAHLAKSNSRNILVFLNFRGLDQASSRTRFTEYNVLYQL